jgi:polyvinyl alcohol dehydrogenase (cytochrome)
MKQVAIGLLCFAVRFAAAQGARGIAVFEEHCAQCHAAPAPDSRAPNRDALRQHTPESILDAMTSGAMVEQARSLTVDQRRQVAEFIAGRPLGASASGDASAMPNRCSATLGDHRLTAAQLSGPMADPMKGPMWNGWGVDLGNSRFQTAAAAGLTADQVPKLKLKWAFGFPNASSMYGQASIAGGRVYVGADTGFVYSLDAKTGCVYWSFQAAGGVRTAPSIGPVKGGYAVYFGDVKANVYAVDAQTGKQIWKQRTDTHPIARVTGAPALAEGVLYVPVASLEELAGGNPAYECCTFRGSMVAYNAETGKQLWKTYTIPQEPKRLKKTSRGTQLWGPAGAAIWSAPSIDLKRGLLYAATGDSYTAPAVPTSDAVMAFDLKTGRVIWTKQVTENDAFVVGNCSNSSKTRSETCPPDQGPDFDFGNSPILRTLPNGHDIIVIGQKSGIGWALDPEKQGAVLWQDRIGKGSALGGIEWGSATDGRLVYFANADASWGPEQAGGLTAVMIQNGERVWSTRPPAIPCKGDRDPDCIQAQSAAITVIPGVVFSASSNGIMRAYASGDGKIIWEYNAAHEYSTVNGVVAKGGGISGPGPAVADGMLFMTSGYTALGGGSPGNVLLAFGLE